MEKEKVTTRLAVPLRRRLKVYAAAAGLTVEDVVSAALEGYLSASAAQMVQAAGEAPRESVLAAGVPVAGAR